MNKHIFADQVIAALGGTNAVARLCNIKPPSVVDWRKNGIPNARLMYLKVIRPDVFEQTKQKVTS